MYDYDENRNPTTRTFVVIDFTVNGVEQEVELDLCPMCNCWFAADTTYLDQVSNVIHCPICCSELTIYIGEDASMIDIGQFDLPRSEDGGQNG